jgi:hypothetical protein
VTAAGSPVANGDVRRLSTSQSRPGSSRACEPVALNRERRMSRWWLAAMLPLVGVAAVFWWLGDLQLPRPEEGGGASLTAAMSMFMMSVGALGAALIATETLLLIYWRESIYWRERSFVHLPIGSPDPPGWFADPWRQAASRWWDGFNWTGRIR